VTTPLKIQDTLIGGDLARWGAGIALDYVYATPEWNRDDALAKVAEARDVGTAVHARIEHILTGEPQSQTPCPRHPAEFGRVACALLPELVPPYVYAFSAFLAEHRPEFLLAEFMVANLTHRYAGTGDIACRLNNRIALIDVKTGKNKESHRLQLAGLSAGEFVGYPDDPERHPVPRFSDFYTLLLRPEGYELVQHDVTSADRKHFFALVKTYRSLREWEKAA